MKAFSTSSLKAIFRVMNSTLVYVLLCLFVFAGTLYAEPSDTLWTKTIGGSGDEWAWCIDQTTDGGYILTGYTASVGAGGWDLWLLKLDSAGDTVWTKTYGGSGEDMGYYVQETSDQGFIISGYTESFGAGGMDLWLIRTDSAGDSLWTRLYGGLEDDEGRYVEEIDDGFCVAGYTWSYGVGLTDLWLLNTDINGDTLWTMTYGGDQYDDCYSAQQTEDGGYILVGATWSYGAGEHDFYMVKTDSAGQLEWQTWYGASQAERYFDVCQSFDSGYLVTGYTWNWVSYSGLYLAKTDEYGNYLWNYIYGMDEQDEGKSVIETDDGGVLAAGWTGEYYGVTSDMYVVQTDQDGNLLWQERYGGDNHDQCYSVIQNSVGNFLLAGFTESYGAGGKDFWIVCLAGDEPQPTGNLTFELVPQNPPIIIPPQGGGFYFDVGISCDSVGNAYFDGWYNVIAPEGQVVGPIVLRQDLFLAANQILEREMYLYLSGWAQSGIYTLEGFAGDYPDSVFSTDSFTFEKLPLDGLDSGNAWAYLIDGDVTEHFKIPDADYHLPHEISLYVSPNPFNPTASITFALPVPTWANLAIYDISGRLVTTLLNGWRDAGSHEVTCDGSSLASGIYIYRLQAGEFSACGKMVLVR